MEWSPNRSRTEPTARIGFSFLGHPIQKTGNAMEAWQSLVQAYGLDELKWRQSTCKFVAIHLVLADVDGKMALHRPSDLWYGHADLKEAREIIRVLMSKESQFACNGLGLLGTLRRLRRALKAGHSDLEPRPSCLKAQSRSSQGVPDRRKVLVNQCNLERRLRPAVPGSMKLINIINIDVRLLLVFRLIRGQPNIAPAAGDILPVRWSNDSMLHYAPPNSNNSLAFAPPPSHTFSSPEHPASNPPGDVLIWVCKPLYEPGRCIERELNTSFLTFHSMWITNMYRGEEQGSIGQMVAQLVSSVKRSPGPYPTVWTRKQDGI
ncbi:hypothetical protein B0H19DRAFT_1069266 [Mycena capillaripes]|nr:hypothetical protein B0H19DRAFT_1086448 [Mycena capillaripes]KAJ6562670.1 hypothetical protein B0H19DRAFT_1069266 [Mycena capillaripes]